MQPFYNENYEKIKKKIKSVKSITTFLYKFDSNNNKIRKVPIDGVRCVYGPEDAEWVDFQQDAVTI